MSGEETRDLCRMGGVSAAVLIAYSLATMVQLALLGGQPATAAEAFRLLQANRILGLLRLDLPTILAMPLYYPLFLGLFAALRRANGAYATLGTGLAFAGVTLLLATPMGLSMLSLSDKYAAATTDDARDRLLSAVMLRGGVFSKATGYVGIMTHGLDLIHGLVGFVMPKAAFLLMAIAGPLYLVWFALLGRRLLQLGRGQPFE